MYIWITMYVGHWYTKFLFIPQTLHLCSNELVLNIQYMLNMFQITLSGVINVNFAVYTYLRTQNRKLSRIE